MSNEDSNNVEDQKNDAQFLIQRIYIKDLSFEVPNAPSVFKHKWEPDLSVDLQTAHHLIEKDVFEVTLTITATVKTQEVVAFLVEIKQAGIFTIQGIIDPEQRDHLLGSFCPNILFPYAREAITAQVTRGSFPQLILAPVNFDALYFEQKQRLKKSEDNSVVELPN